MRAQRDGRLPPKRAEAHPCRPARPRGGMPSDAIQGRLAHSNAATTTRPLAPAPGPGVSVCCSCTLGVTPKSPRAFAWQSVTASPPFCRPEQTIAFFGPLSRYRQRESSDYRVAVARLVLISCCRILQIDSGGQVRRHVVFLEME